ncbi:hypothetical protein GCM10023068_41310 [Leifsonia shinshuensis]
MNTTTAMPTSTHGPNACSQAEASSSGMDAWNAMGPSVPGTTQGPSKKAGRWKARPRIPPARDGAPSVR